jgi:hypothetical protein
MPLRYPPHSGIGCGRSSTASDIRRLGAVNGWRYSYRRYLKRRRLVLTVCGGTYGKQQRKAAFPEWHGETLRVVDGRTAESVQAE